MTTPQTPGRQRPKKQKRKRINLSVQPETYDALQKIATRYRFINICDICTTLINVFIKLVCRPHAKVKQRQTITETVEEMFKEFENWEPTPSPENNYKQTRNFFHTDTDGPAVVADDSDDDRQRSQDDDTDTGSQDDSEAGEIFTATRQRPAAAGEILTGDRRQRRALRPGKRPGK